MFENLKGGMLDYWNIGFLFLPNEILSCVFEIFVLVLERSRFQGRQIGVLRNEFFAHISRENDG